MSMGGVTTVSRTADRQNCRSQDLRLFPKTFIESFSKTIKNIFKYHEEFTEFKHEPPSSPLYSTYLAEGSWQNRRDFFRKIADLLHTNADDVHLTPPAEKGDPGTEDVLAGSHSKQRWGRLEDGRAEWLKLHKKLLQIYCKFIAINLEFCNAKFPLTLNYRNIFN